MKSRSKWITSIVAAVIWIAITAGIAYMVARNTEPETTSADITADVPPIGSGTRTTVSLTEHLIAPVVSGNGGVVQNGDVWLLEAPASPADVAYKLVDSTPVGVRALITGGPVGFPCPWAGLGQSLEGGVTIRCTIPPEIPVVAGLTGSLVLQMGIGTAATALPVTAVAGSAEQGQVIVVGADGSVSVRAVQLGVADAFWIEIVGGLDPSEFVMEFPTQRDFAMAAA